MYPLRRNQDPASSLHYCFLTASPLFLHPVPSLMVVIAQLCWTLCDPMDCSSPGFPVLYRLLEFAQLMSIESMMPFNHLILCCPLLLLPSIFPSISVFSESALCIRWPKYWSFSFSISPSNERLISFRMDWFDLLAVQRDSQESSPASEHGKHQFFGAQPSLWPGSLSCTRNTVALTIQTFVNKAMSVLFNTLSRFVIAFLP